MVKLITGIAGILIAGLILWLIRRDYLHVRHGLTWTLVACGFALLGFLPGLLDGIARAAGIGYPPVIGLSVGLALLVVKVLVMDIERSRAEVRIDRLVQRMAILEERVRALSD